MYKIGKERKKKETAIAADVVHCPQHLDATVEKKSKTGAVLMEKTYAHILLFLIDCPGPICLAHEAQTTPRLSACRRRPLLSFPILMLPTISNVRPR